jgi:hypothetical protein
MSGTAVTRCAYCDGVADDHASGAGSVALPERVTVLTCIGCGAMGREQRCVNCSEHKLELVSATDYEQMLTAAGDARDRAEQLAPTVRHFAEIAPEAVMDTDRALLRERAREVLQRAPHVLDAPDSAVDSVTGWWCAECGNVDLPQPCIGVCVWRPAEWINLGLYEQQRRLAEPWWRADRALSAFLSRARSVTPRPGQEARHWLAVREQAVRALAEYEPGGLAPNRPSDAASGVSEPVVTVHSWPR